MADTHVLGCDPGQDGALALVRLDGARKERPVVLGWWAIYGDERPRQRRLSGALLQVLELLGDADLDAVAIEEPGGRGASHKSYGPDTWLGLGWYAGQVQGAIGQLCPNAAVQRIGSDLWPRKVGVRVGKRDDGRHRIAEARQAAGFAPDMASVKTAADLERVVAAAEAVLIGVAGGLTIAEQRAVKRLKGAA